MKEAGLRLCGIDGEIILDVLDPRARKFIQKNDDSFLSQLRDGPIRVGSFARLFIGRADIYTMLQTPRLTVKEAGHSAVTQAAYQPFNIGIPFFGYGKDAQNSLLTAVSDADYPPLPSCTIVDILAATLSNVLGESRHALRTLTFDLESGKPQLRSVEETRAALRFQTRNDLERLHTIKGLLELEEIDFILSPKLGAIRDKIDLMEDAYREAQALTGLGAEETVIKQERQKVVALIKELRSSSFGASLYGVRFCAPETLKNGAEDPLFCKREADDYQDMEALNMLMRPYREIRQNIDLLAEVGDTQEAVQAFSVLMLYFPKDQWSSLASGKVALLAEGRRVFATLLHRVQDAIAHCHRFDEEQKSVCVEYVTVNYFGMGTFHNEGTDDLHGVQGHEREMSFMAKEISVEVLRLLYHEPGDPDFEEELSFLLDTYWPLDKVETLIADQTKPSRPRNPGIPLVPHQSGNPYAADSTAQPPFE
jgi:hypothetical protein